MLNKEQLQTIKKETYLLLQKMGEQAEVSLQQIEPGASAHLQMDPPQSMDAGGEPGDQPAVRVSLQTADPKMLIGERGQTLFELQHILRLILRKKIDTPFYLSLDVNEYKQNREEYLRDLARTTADEVALLKKPKQLAPMSAAERRIIHVALSVRTDVVSESLGEGPDRRVAIRLKE